MGTSNEQRSQTFFYLVILLLASLLVFFVNLDGRALWGSDETREGEIAREMIETGDYIVPRLNGNVLAWKPPLYHWFIVLSSGLGKVTPFSIRFPSALFGLGGVLLTFLLGKKLINGRTGFIGGMVLLSSNQYWWLARYGRIDMTLTFFFTLSLVSFWLGLNREKGKPLFYLLFYLSMGLATLSKGPVGLVLPCLIVFAYLSITRQLARLKEMELVLGPALFIVVTGPWYLLSGIKGGPGFTYELVIRQSFIRFLDAFDHHEAIWAYLPYFSWYFMPWSFLFPASVAAIFHKEAGEKRKDLLFPLIWFGMVLVFFSFSQSGRSIYILPLYPAASLLVAYGWERFLRTAIEGHDFKGFRFSILILAGVLMVSSGSSALYVHTKMPEWFPVALVVGPILAVLCLGLAVLVIKRRTWMAFSTLFCLAVGSVLLYSFLVVPKIDARISSKPFVERIKVSLGESGALRAYVIARPSLVFFMERHIKVIDTEEDLRLFLNSPNQVYVLMEKPDYLKLMARDNLPIYIVDVGPMERHSALLVSNRP